MTKAEINLYNIFEEAVVNEGDGSRLRTQAAERIKELRNDAKISQEDKKFAMHVAKTNAKEYSKPGNRRNLPSDWTNYDDQERIKIGKAYQKAYNNILKK